MVNEPGTCNCTLTLMVAVVVLGGMTMYGMFVVTLVGLAHVIVMGMLVLPTFMPLYMNESVSLHDGLVGEHP
jgi:hypothetical protein